jgi:hypothetical protein
MPILFSIAGMKSALFTDRRCIALFILAPFLLLALTTYNNPIMKKLLEPKADGGGGGNGDGITITNVAIIVFAPVKDETPDTTAGGSGNFTIGSVSWSPPHAPFEGNAVYTATVTLTVKID